MHESFQQQQFLNVIDRDEAERRFRAVLDLSPLESEQVLLAHAWRRILADDITAPVDVPGFDRANVDGFAVKADDTFGATEDTPRFLALSDEAIPTGVTPKQRLSVGTAAPIATGGMTPRGADAVVMVEYTSIDNSKLRLTRPVAPGANITFAGTDIGRGETVLRRGVLLGSRETGVLAAIGIDRVAVVRKPRVAILSTGDELVPPGTPIQTGQIYDSNATILADAVREFGGEPIGMGIVSDDFDQLVQIVNQAIETADVVLLSGGTSKGAGDVSYRVLNDLGPPGIVAHGVALKPGKPLCLAAVNRSGRRPIPVAVLPGFPTSAIFTFREFLAPVIRALAGRREDPQETVTARLPMRVNSERGRTEYLLVSLVESDGFTAYPMGKGSGSVTAYSGADGFIVIPRQREYLEAGESVEVQLLHASLRPAELVVIGSHCIGLDFLLGLLRDRGISSKYFAMGSTGGLEAAKRGQCDLAGVHLLDPATDTYNRLFLTPELELIQGYCRMQGLVYRHNDQRFKDRSIADAMASALADSQCVMVNRNRGSGTRILIDQLLQGSRPEGYLVEARSHNAVVAAVAQGRADWGIAIEPAALALGLGFTPLRPEHYDFVVPVARRERPALAAFRELLARRDVRAKLAQMGFSCEPK